jgi:uncharacterized protein (UPF0276 family)
MSTKDEVLIATPVSELFRDPTVAKQIMAHSDCLEGRDHYEQEEGRTEVYHCDSQPIHELSDDELDMLKGIAQKNKRLKLITFHLASACDAPVLSGFMFLPGGKQRDKDELLQTANRNIEQIRRIFGDQVMIGVENNNYFPTEAYNHVTEPDFICDIVSQNGIYLLLDLAHAKITSSNREVSYQDYLGALPLKRVIQVHISLPGYNAMQRISFDAHEAPGEAELREAIELQRRCPSLRYFTIEYYKEARRLIGLLKQLRGMINELS